MSEIIITHEPVSLISGNYSILKKHLIIQLDEIRKEELQYEKDKLINSCQYAVTSAPWKQLRGDDYIVEFKWFEGKEPEIVDSKYQILYDIAWKLPALCCGIHCGITISRVVVNKARLKQLPKVIYIDLKMKREK